MYSIRTHCIFCNKQLENPFFENDLSIPIACYCKENETDDDVFIPYNVYTCRTCKTTQTKYLGDLNIIYKYNHADSTGKIMNNLHKKVGSIIKKNIHTITNITEIGSAKGVLSNIVIQECPTIEKYYIIEPQFIGDKHEKQVIINDFFENVDYNKYTDSNTIVISHVFEHFYNPLHILNVITKNNNIQNIVLVWPDLEYYKDHNIFHVLNTEHTFYIDNNFIISLLKNHSFEMVENMFYENHSVIFYFTRSNSTINEELINNNFSIANYYNDLLDKKENLSVFIRNNKEKNKQICIWPASVHTQFVLMLLQITPDYVLDNSPNKIGKYLYGYNLECKPFYDNCHNSDMAIIINGGPFNKEVVDTIKIDKTQIFII